MGICLIVKSGGGVDTSGATATADTILNGYTIYKDDAKITGTMVNVGNQNNADTTWGNTGGKYSCWPDGTIWIWKGWHDGTSGVNAVSLASQTGGFDMPGTDYCLWGYTYWTDGNRYSGTMPALGKQTWTLGANGTQTIGWGWHDGTGTVSQSLNVDNGEWGVGGSTSQQQLCWSGWYYSKNRWCWGASTLVADNIKKDVVIYGVKGTWATTARMLIENGALTGMVSSAWVGTFSSIAKTTSYGGSNWILLYATGAWWGGSDEGYSTSYEGWLRFDNINTIASVTPTSSIGFNVRGDLLQWRSAGGTGASGGYVYYGYRENYGWRWSLPSSPSVSTGNATWSLGSTNVTSAKNWNSITSLPVNSFIMKFSRGGSLKASYDYAVWAKNLWLDTTVTVTIG